MAPADLFEPSPAELRFDQQLDEVREVLPPDLRDEVGATDVDAAQLAEQMARHLAELSPEERHQWRRRLAVSASDIQGLIDDLQQDLVDLADGLRALTRHHGAARAYMVGAQQTRHDRSS